MISIINHLTDPLWDGNGCTIGSRCCAQIGMPQFYGKLPVPVVDDFEVHICKDEGYNTNEDVAVAKIDIFVPQCMQLTMSVCSVVY